MKRLGKILEIIFFVVVAIVSFKSIWSFVDAKTGYHCPFAGLRECVIVSDSMSFVDSSNKERLEGYTNQFKKGDVVCTNTYFSYEDLKPGDIITYKKEDSSLICHRIVAKLNKDGVNGLITQGDANKVTDGFIDYKYVNGRVYSILYGMGTVIDFFQSGYGMIALFAVIGFVALGEWIYDVTEYGKYRKFKKGYNKSYSEDRSIVLLPDNVKKTIKNFRLVDCSCVYQFNYHKKELELQLNYLPKYENKMDKSVVSNNESMKTLIETIVLSVLPICENKIYKGKDGFSYGIKLLKKKGIRLSNDDILNTNELYIVGLREKANKLPRVKIENNLLQSYRLIRNRLSNLNIKESKLLDEIFFNLAALEASKTVEKK